MDKEELESQVDYFLSFYVGLTPTTKMLYEYGVYLSDRHGSNKVYFSLEKLADKADVDRGWLSTCTDDLRNVGFMKKKRRYKNLGLRTRKVKTNKNNPFYRHKRMSELGHEMKHEKGSRRNLANEYYVDPLYKELYKALGVRELLTRFEGVENFLGFITEISKKTFKELLTNGNMAMALMRKLYTRASVFLLILPSKGNAMINSMTVTKVDDKKTDDARKEANLEKGDRKQENGRQEYCAPEVKQRLEDCATPNEAYAYLVATKRLC